MSQTIYSVAKNDNMTKPLRIKLRLKTRKTILFHHMAKLYLMEFTKSSGLPTFGIFQTLIY